MLKGPSAWHSWCTSRAAALRKWARRHGGTRRLWFLVAHGGAGSSLKGRCGGSSSNCYNVQLPKRKVLWLLHQLLHRPEAQASQNAILWKAILSTRRPTARKEKQTEAAMPRCHMCRCACCVLFACFVVFSLCVACWVVFRFVLRDLLCCLVFVWSIIHNYCFAACAVF